MAPILLLALALRLPSIGRDSLWFDEAISYLTAQLPLPLILNNSVQSSHPPLYYLLLHFWQQSVPDGDAALRGLSVLWSLLLIPLLYRLTTDLFGDRRLGLAAALLAALSPFHVLYSHELRMYTQLMFLVTLLVWAYWRARQGTHPGWWLLFAVAALTAVYTHLFAFLALAGVGLHALLHWRERGAFWRTAVIIGVVTLLFLPWLQLMLGESEQALGSLRPLAQDTTLNPVKPLISLTFLIFGISGNVVYSGAALFLTLAMVVILLLETRRLWRDGVPDGAVLAMLVVLMVLGVPLLVYLVRPFFLPERTLAAASPLLLVLLAWSVTRRQSPLPWLVGGTAVVMLAGTVLYHLGGPLKPPYRDVMQAVSAQNVQNEVVLHTSDGSLLPGLRYAPELTQWVLAGDPDPRKPEAVYRLLGSDTRRLAQVLQEESLWVVVALEHSVAWQQEQVGKLADNYVEINALERGGIFIYQYQSP